MKHSTKKLLALALALVMVLSLAPLTANAEGKERATGKGTVEKISAQGTRGGVLNASGENEVSPRRAGGKKTGSLIVGVSGDSRTVTATASDGAVVEITGVLPRGAEAKIEPVTLTKDELIQFYGADFVDAVDELVVYDICILVDGKEWEPDKSVSVVIKSPAIEVKESAEEVAVTHLDDAKKSAETVETALTEDGDLRFETDSFSLWGLFTYTVDYYLNDKKYHQPGNTSMLLSELFEALECPYQASEVTELTFTDDTLLAIERVEEDDDWRITSLMPFSTDELLTVTLEDGSYFSIVVHDRQYRPYRCSSNLTPYSGSFAYHGHYDIFGGGNGLATAASPNPAGSSIGLWGGFAFWDSAASIVGVPTAAFNGRAQGNDEEGNDLDPTPGQFKTGSSAVITWEGTVKRAILSFGYSDNTYGSTGHYDIKLYAPDGAVAWIDLTLDGYAEDPRPPQGETMDLGWRYLSFDATSFVSAHPPGTYTMVVIVEPAPGYDSAGAISDMGWTIYGISESPALDYAAIVGIVDEKVISGGDDLPYADAIAEFSEPITPKGSGKVWVGVHGGEVRYYDGIKKLWVDEDYLEAKIGDNSYLKFGTGGDIPISGWTWNDIAKPNNNHTAPAGRTKFQNRFAFGLSEYSGLNIDQLLGVRKRMLAGFDVFGSMMLLVEVRKAEGTVDLPKELQLDNNGFADFDALPEDATFSFTITPVDGAPAPVPPPSPTVTFPAGSQTGDLADISFGTFTFTEPGTYSYEVTEESVTAPWIRDTRTLLLTLEVVENTAEDKFEIQTETWSVKGDPSDTRNYFINEYVLPVRLDVEKTDVEGNAVSGAKFLLYSNSACTTVADVYIDAAMTTALTADNTPATDGSGIASFYGLDKDETYYLKEVSVPAPYILDSTVVTISYNATAGQWEQDGSAMDAEYDETNAIGVLSLTRQNNETVSVSVVKSWDDSENQDRIRPASVQVRLYKQVGSGAKSAVGGAVTLRADSTPTAWGHTWTDLPKYELNGTTATEITYSVEEVTVPGGYTVSYAPADGVPGSDGLVTVTNKHTPEKTTVTVTKVWDDNNSNRRPTSVTIKLLANGAEVGSVELNEGNSWTHTWTDLDKYADGKVIRYTVSEDRVPGYQKPVITGSAASGFTVKNKLRTSNSPFTGDNRAWLPWVGVLVLSGAALGVDAVVRKRKRGKEK